MSMFATPKVAEHGDELGKDDLLDTLAVFQVTEYDPEASTKYGTTATVICHTTVCEGELAGTVEERFFAAGNLAKQIGEALDVGDMAPGRIVKGTSANGRSWYGITWATEEADLKAAEEALTPGRDVPADTPPAAAVAMVAESLGGQVRATVSDLKARAADTAPGDEPPPF